MHSPHIHSISIPKTALGLPWHGLPARGLGIWTRALIRTSQNHGLATRATQSAIALFSFIFAFTLAFVPTARANVTLAPLFRDHAVFQRDKPLPIWGRADVGEHVTVTFRGQTISTTATADAGATAGRWIVYLAPVSASTQPAELTVTGKNTVRVTDILTGEVWLCSGQSNMERKVSQTLNADQEIATASNPLIRVITIKHRESDTPVTDAETTGWLLPSPQTAPDFSAVGYYFARDLQPRLGVPIGIIHSSWGGTQIESWISAATLNANPAFAVVAQRWQKLLADYPASKAAYDKTMSARAAEQAAAKAKNEKPKTYPYIRPPAGHGHQDTPSGLFNGMINPLMPFALRGVLWYQGESNAIRPNEYHALFAAMITQWRSNLGQGDIPFFWVQLPNYKNNNNANATDWASLREAQTQTLTLPATAQAVTIDIGEPDNIHPLNKQEVARRLALIARALVYGATVDYSGPILATAKREGAAMRVSFAKGADGLTARSKPLQSFELAGADKIFHPATAQIDSADNTILVTSKAVPDPVAVRYAWRNSPEANLFNSAGLPAAPFRSDDWN